MHLRFFMSSSGLSLRGFSSLLDPDTPRVTRGKHTLCSKIMINNSNFDQHSGQNPRTAFDTAQYKAYRIVDIRLVDKHEASKILGISPETLKKYRLQGSSTLIEGIHYHVWNKRVIRYNPFLIADWGLNRNNPQAHQRTIEAYLKSLPSNQSKRGRRAS